MAEDPDHAFLSVMHTLAAAALRTNLTRCDVLDAALRAIEQGDVEVGLLTGAERAAHQVVGSAGTFGFPEVSRLAAELEHYLTRVIAGRSAAAGGDGGAVSELAQAWSWLTQMRAELESGSAGGHQPAG